MYSRLKSLSHISRSDSAALCEALLRETDQTVILDVLSSLRADQVKAPMLLGFIDTCRAHQVRFDTETSAIDIVGTGGDGKQSLNISTVSSFIIAACGQPVLKHGNRASTSKAGSADYLQSVGVPMYKDPQQIKQSLTDKGYAYCYAPYFLSGLQTIASCRRQLNFPTIFNLLGPCLNPGNIKRAVIGVYAESIMQMMAGALLELGMEHALIVHGSGYDELNTVASNYVIEIENGYTHHYQLNPISIGLSITDEIVLHRRSTRESNTRLSAILAGDVSDPAIDTILLNVAAGLFVGGSVSSIDEGIGVAYECIASHKINAFMKSLRPLDAEVNNA